MDKPIIYSQEQGRTFDVLNGWKDVIKGFGGLAQSLFGTTATIVTGFSAAQNSTPNLSIILAAGHIFSWQATDTNTWGTLASDSTNIYQKGYADQQTLTFSTAGISAGQEQWVAVQAQYTQTDAVRASDPNNGILPYYNSANPTVPLQGPAGGGGTQPTVRKGVAQIALVYGTPATAGSAVPPSAGGNYVTLYLVKLVFGQTTITNGQILKAGNAAYAGYTEAPFCNGLLGQHHKGTTGHAPKIDLTAEVQGILPLANLPASNTVGVLPCFRQGSGNPNGSVNGKQSDLYFDTATGTMYTCTAALNVTSNIDWQALNAAPKIIPVNTSPYTITNLFATYIVDTTGGNITMNLPALATAFAANACVTIIKGSNDANKVTIDAGSGNNIAKGAARAQTVDIVAPDGSQTLTPCDANSMSAIDNVWFTT